MTSGWDEAPDLSDEDLVDELIAASLPELTDGRAILFEELRRRFDAVPRRAARTRRALEEDFVEWFWNYERLVLSLMGYRRSGAKGRLEAYLGRKARWLFYDFLRSPPRRKRRLLGDPPAAPSPAAGEAEEKAVRLAVVRACVERLRPSVRVPFKLVHVETLELTEEDWAFAAASAGVSRAAIEAAVAAYRAAAPTARLAAVGEILRKKLHTVGTYVKRAMDGVKECVRLRAARERRP
jgi:DNA-directed RNA polymerase specialized sigma24 family protein